MKNTIFFTVINSIRLILERAVELLYPPCCPFCDQWLGKLEKQIGICRKCQNELVYITDVHCMKCGKPLSHAREEFCYDCTRRDHQYDQARALLSYQGKTKTSLYRFKNYNRREYARFYGDEIHRMLGTWIKNCHADYLIPIPLFHKKDNERGYNQALLLAEAISRRTGIMCLPNLLIKITDTRQQKELDVNQRQKNLERAFAISDSEKDFSLVGKRVVLVDDIYTTGATVDAAAAVLKRAKVSKIFVLTLAIGG